MRVVVFSANLGGFENSVDSVPQNISFDFHRFTDQNFPPRKGSMTPRLQARLVKMFGWQMLPEYDLYVWIDSSCMFPREDSLKWFIDKCEGVDMAVMKHPNRNTIQEEYDYVIKRLEGGCKYLTPRYENDFFKEQVDEIRNDKDFVDNKLFASTVMVYRNNQRVRDMFKEWWYHTTRYTTEEQLSLPYVMWKNKCTFNIIQEKYLENPYLKYVRT